MAVVVTDSMAFYDTLGDAGSRWNLDTSRGDYLPAGGQWGTGAVKFDAGNATGHLRHNPATEAVLGARFSPGIPVALGAGITFMRGRALWKWVTTDACEANNEECFTKEETFLMELRFNEDGTVTVFVETPFLDQTWTVFHSDEIVFPSEESFYYVEMSMTAGVSGAVWVEDQPVISFSHNPENPDPCCTLRPGYPVLEWVEMTCLDNQLVIPPASATFHDAYVTDNASHRLGPVRSRVRRPEVDITDDWTPSGGGSNWEEVDEKQKDDDTTYNRTTTAGNRDEFECGPDPSPGPPEIFTLATVTAAKTDGPAGGRTLQQVLNGSLVGSEISLPDVYEYEHTIFETNPATGDPWTASEADAATMGYELTE